MKPDYKQISRRKFIDLSSKGIIISSFLPAMLPGKKGSGPEISLPRQNVNAYISDPNKMVQQLALFTETHRRHQHSNITDREIACLKVQYPVFFCDIQDNDLFAGRERRPPIGFAPQADGFGYHMNESEMKALMTEPTLSSKNKHLADSLMKYWEKETSQAKTRAAYTEHMKEVFWSEEWGGKPVIGAPLYRMSGTQCDFDKLCQLGVEGLRQEIQGYKKMILPNDPAYILYGGMEKALDLFAEVAGYYADMCEKQAKNASGNRKQDLLEMRKALDHIAIHKPQSFREAIQLTLLYADICGTFNYGRMDEYLGDFYVNDMQRGVLNEEEAIRLLSNLWLLIDAKGNIWDSRVIVGGKGRRNEENADKFALVAMETTKRVKGIVPQFTLRFYKGQNPLLFETALDVIGTGNPYPMLYNDDVNIPSVMNAFRIPYEEAIHYLPFGCGEYILNHRSVGTPSGVINLLQALTVTLHKGISPVAHLPVGIQTSDFGELDSFEKLFSAYKRNVEYYVEQLAYQEKLEYDFAGTEAPFLFLSMVFDDCIKRGKGIFGGGIRYLGGTLESYGNTNTADSLTAIKKLVYEDKKLSLNQLVNILDANFEGYEKEHKWMLEAPKYGNDDDYADSIKVSVDEHICNYTRNMGPKSGLHSYLIVIINNSANTTMGMQTAASPDGRKAFTYMANANAPAGGMDKNGVTAFLNSIVKPDTKIHAGAVQNMKFSKEMFSTYRDKTESLLKTYFQKGGAQCMINCIGRDDLENAMKYPEKFANLIVRVGGFSARFVELPHEVQLEILSRTLY